jgi:hypothetical protein
MSVKRGRLCSSQTTCKSSRSQTAPRAYSQTRAASYQLPVHSNIRVHSNIPILKHAEGWHLSLKHTTLALAVLTALRSAQEDLKSGWLSSLLFAGSLETFQRFCPISVSLYVLRIHYFFLVYLHQTFFTWSKMGLKRSKQLHAFEPHEFPEYAVASTGYHGY